MSIIEFIKEKSVFLSVNLILFIISAVVMVLSHVSSVIIILTACIWFLPLLLYMITDYIKWRRYFNNIEDVLSNLDKKYLLPEVMDKADSITSEKISEILKTVSRSMHENVKYYRNMQEDYREYIEAWVHEIKTPIASSKLLIENNNNEVTKKIDMQMDRIENYVEQVLYYSKSNETEKDYIIKKVSLDESVRNVIKRNYRDMIAKRIKVEMGELSSIVYSDPKWIEFILNQIVVNSIKYSKDKESMIQISSEELKNSVTLTIEDNGIGIPEKDVKRVFDKGFTGKNGRKYGKSTGIGLYLCRKLCLRLGIGISLQSEEGKYTKVIITFPQFHYTNIIQ
ncbi:MAG: sensor histidine kinase [Inconstantimicrobium porci]|uniref:sensor histidine kinase n=1 Tax=Inconstantimicrobium porci TaxID=2652291 RepID=UPI002A91274C|nr:sensor histidine kinase [Inconstantimicrobium porci]MDY5911031.1 sensor histidine kinase [Inconstantimicrobium porci]